MKPIIKVENLGKQYRIGTRSQSYATLRETIVEMARAPFTKLRGTNGGRADETIWALREVDMEVAAGEVVGIIGRNGAGKSTLLKILSRITDPTTGRVDLYGRVGSLLEVGTGFHPELTGRENVYLNGAILGMHRSEIERRFDEIVAFSELEKFLDTPVKRYSSGMYMRLAFAVAAHLEPEILVVDEVLAVGDSQFQKKCLGKMDEVAKGGRTVIFVSHNMAAVQALCNRVVWLDGGKVVAEGESGRVVSNYLKTSFSALTERIWDDRQTAPGNDKVRLHRARVRPQHGHPSDNIDVHTPIVVEFDFWNLVNDAYLNLNFALYNEEGRNVFQTAPANETEWHGRAYPVGLFRSSCFIPGNLLNDGGHRLELLVVKDQTVVVYSDTELLAFEVRDDVDVRGGWHGKWPGAVRPNLEWKTELLARG